jgi:hypothetical protein
VARAARITPGVGPVQGGDPLAAGDLAAVGVEPAGDDGREAPGADLAVQLLQMPLQVVDGAGVARSVDAGEVQEGPPAVDSGQPPQVGVVGRLTVITR